MVQCTWFDKKPREHRAAFVTDSLEVAEATTLRSGPLAGGAQVLDRLCIDERLIKIEDDHLRMLTNPAPVARRPCSAG